MVDVKDKSEEFERVIKADGTVTDGIIIKLTDEVLNVIREKAKQVHDASFSTVGKLVIGLMGQAAVAYEIENNWREGVDQMGLVPDMYDLLYRGCMLEVKTFDIRGYSRKPHSYMAVPLSQFHKPDRHYPFYIGNLRISANEICIMGFVTHKFLEHLESIHSTAMNVVVKNRDDFVGIEHLDAAIDEYLR